MSIVFSYVPSLVYPSEIVNVGPATGDSGVVSGNLTEFYVRCDKADNGRFRSDLLKACNAPTFFVTPDCDIPPMHSYWYRVFTFAEMECGTTHLQQFTRTENLGVNLVALASSMMIIGALLCFIPFICLCR